MTSVTVSDFDYSYPRPDREGAMRFARGLYPDSTDQRLEELLWAHTSFPLGDLEQWKLQIVEQRLNARTIFPLQ